MKTNLCIFALRIYKQMSKISLHISPVLRYFHVLGGRCHQSDFLSIEAAE